jgi:thiamine pyrophosphate-dependent acetolactate synthase large subunit-like protein
MADARTAAEILADTLIARQVEVVFGRPGDGITGIIEAFAASWSR